MLWKGEHRKAKEKEQQIFNLISGLRKLQFTRRICISRCLLMIGNLEHFPLNRAKIPLRIVRSRCSYVPYFFDKSSDLHCLTKLFIIILYILYWSRDLLHFLSPSLSSFACRSARKLDLILLSSPHFSHLLRSEVVDPILPPPSLSALPFLPRSSRRVPQRIYRISARSIDKRCWSRTRTARCVRRLQTWITKLQNYIVFFKLYLISTVGHQYLTYLITIY